jgi:hypothetical protein
MPYSQYGDQVTKFVAGVLLAAVSAAALALLLALALLPLITSLSGYYTVGLSLDAAGLRFVAAAGVFGGVGLVGGIWLARADSD